MKLSLAWIFDHIEALWQDVNIDNLVLKFNQVTAEIEQFYKVNICLNNFYVAQKVDHKNNFIFIPELDLKVSMLSRESSVDIVSKNIENVSFLVKKNGDSFDWVTISDFGLDKDGLFPAVDISKECLDGGWRNSFESEDIIIEVDNKSITHRPDMWGHRGFAREIAAFLNLQLKPKKAFLANHKILSFRESTQPTESCPYVIVNKSQNVCTKFNGLFFNFIENRPTNLLIASRLLKIGSRPISAIVDLTNYVMNDWSQPVHAYDADKLEDKKIVVRFASDGEKLEILDGTNLELTSNDLVITDGKKPIGLAGVKGGLEASIGPETQRVFFEAANFDPMSIRCSAQRHKTRTDSSARFEKTLDPNQAVDSILRFIKLTTECGMKSEYADEIVAVGDDAPVKKICVTHRFLEEKSGIKLSEDDVERLLSPLEFKVETVDGSTYDITIPTFRSSKDVEIKEDVLEEVIRTFGFNKVELELPRILKKPCNLEYIFRLRKIKQFLASVAGMIEQQNYVFYDEKKLKEFELSIPDAVEIVNPVTENFRRLVVSLIPSLLKNVDENLVHHDDIRFFEFGRTWQVDGDKVIENKSLAGVLFSKKSEIDFFEHKNIISELFRSLGFDDCDFEWKRIDSHESPWYKPFQTSEIVFKKSSVGIVGCASSEFLGSLGMHDQNQAFIFEIDGKFLLEGQASEIKYKPFSKYQDTFLDFSFLAPLNLTVERMESKFNKLSPIVISVQLIDFFEKNDWQDVRSLTFRLWLSSCDKAVEKDEIDLVSQKAIEIINDCGGELRA
jgi:phenylalanyl-tRNA synthetase beta chain